MPESVRSRSRLGRATAASCWRTVRSRRSSSTWKRCRRCRGTHAAPTAWEAIEIHLATNFQNIVFDHPKLPAELRGEINAWVKAECKDEWKKGDTEQQFIYKARKKAIGPFKRRLWDLPASVRQAIAADLEKTFAFLFEQLRVTNTRAIVDRFVRPPLQSHAEPRAVAA